MQVASVTPAAQWPEPSAGACMPGDRQQRPSGVDGRVAGGVPAHETCSAPSTSCAAARGPCEQPGKHERGLLLRAFTWSADRFSISSHMCSSCHPTCRA